MFVLGRLVSGMAHEVANPIQTILAIGEQMKSSLSKQRVEEDAAEDLARLAMIIEQTERIGRVVHEFADFANPAPAEMEPTSVNLAIESAIRLLRLDRRFRGIEVFSDLNRDVPMVRGVANQLTHATIDILIHAIESMREATSRISVSSRREEDFALVIIEDHGCGISPAPSEKSTNLFDAARLAVSRAIIDRHHGDLEIESRPDHRPRVVIRIPIMKETDPR
jgi:C4-dicarboxylate-specific signal transduction histidine kinase